MQRWNVGLVEITAVEETDLALNYGTPGTVIPDATPEALGALRGLSAGAVGRNGVLNLRVQAMLVKTPSAEIVIDPCIGNGRVRRSPSFAMLDTNFLERFRETGWSTDEVTHVVNTHLHVDHVGWNTTAAGDGWMPTFPKARYVMSQADFEFYAASQDDDRQRMFADSITPIVDAGLAAFIEAGVAISPEVRLISTAGHSPGHASVLIESQGRRAVITGDVMHHPSQVWHPEWSSSFDHDPVAARRTREAFLERFADGETLVIGTHFVPPSAGFIERDGNGFAFRGVVS